MAPEKLFEFGRRHILDEGSGSPIGLDEPVFLIRGADAAAPGAIGAWAEIAERLGALPEIVLLARQRALSIASWQSGRGSKIPDLPGFEPDNDPLGRMRELAKLRQGYESLQQAYGRALDAELNRIALERSPFKPGDRAIYSTSVWRRGEVATEQRWLVERVTGRMPYRAQPGDGDEPLIILHCIRILKSGGVGVQRQTFSSDELRPAESSTLPAAGEEEVRP